MKVRCPSLPSYPGALLEEAQGISRLGGPPLNSGPASGSPLSLTCPGCLHRERLGRYPDQTTDPAELQSCSTCAKGWSHSVKISHFRCLNLQSYLHNGHFTEP